MSHTPIHDHGHDHDPQASSSASLMGIDASAPNDERSILLDVEREESAQYGSTVQINNGGWCRIW
jgi:hypothetical protein